jgi:endogenous inhibitor of DNA gyrase (YacG/DUF329 family)
MARQPTCVYCRRQPANPAWHPFCCERCKMADLGRWLGGEYRVPGPPVAVDDDDGPSWAPGPGGTEKD